MVLVLKSFSRGNLSIFFLSSGYSDVVFPALLVVFLHTALPGLSYSLHYLFVIFNDKDTLSRLPKHASNRSQARRRPHVHERRSVREKEVEVSVREKRHAFFFVFYYF